MVGLGLMSGVAALLAALTIGGGVVRGEVGVVVGGVVLGLVAMTLLIAMFGQMKRRDWAGWTTAAGACAVLGLVGASALAKGKPGGLIPLAIPIASVVALVPQTRAALCAGILATAGGAALALIVG